MGPFSHAPSHILTILGGGGGELPAVINLFVSCSLVAHSSLKQDSMSGFLWEN